MRILLAYMIITRTLLRRHNINVHKMAHTMYSGHLGTYGCVAIIQLLILALRLAQECFQYDCLYVEHRYKTHIIVQPISIM